MNLIPCSGMLPISRVLYTQDNVILTSVVGDKKNDNESRLKERETVREREGEEERESGRNKVRERNQEKRWREREIYPLT